MFKQKSPWVILLVTFLAASMFCYFPVWHASRCSSDNPLFRVVQWPSKDALPWGYTIVSDRIFPLTVYVVSLPEVGNVRLSNHSAIIDGVLKAVEVYPNGSEVKQVRIELLGHDLGANLNVNVSYVLLKDWRTYETALEQGNGSIIVNTHDQCLPVPNGYTKEEWVDRIADFMQNRWGTWVHIGGYPFYSVWYENGTTIDWGSAGYARLMSHIGKENATCYPVDNKSVCTEADLEGLLFSWWLLPVKYESAIGYPMRWGDFNGNIITYMFGSGAQSHSASLFAQNASSFNFGVYVHLGTSEFYRGYGGGGQPEFIAGFIPTATAIYVEYSFIAKLYGMDGDSASELIQRAVNEGRTVGLDTAKDFFQKALDSYAVGNYKIAASYASEAAGVAATSSRPPNMPVVVSGILSVSAGIAIGVTGVHRKRDEKNMERNEETQIL